MTTRVCTYFSHTFLTNRMTDNQNEKATNILNIATHGNFIKKTYFSLLLLTNSIIEGDNGNCITDVINRHSSLKHKIIIVATNYNTTMGHGQYFPLNKVSTIEMKHFLKTQKTHKRSYTALFYNVRTHFPCNWKCRIIWQFDTNYKVSSDGNNGYEIN